MTRQDWDDILTRAGDNPNDGIEKGGPDEVVKLRARVQTYRALKAEIEALKERVRDLDGKA